MLDLLSLLPLRGAARDLHSGSGLTANRINLPNASELYPAFNWVSRSSRPALSYRPLLALRPHFSARTVTSLEPRTPHQPDKLKKLSKNDYGFTPFIFKVNGIPELLTRHFSIECRPCTGGCRKSCAAMLHSLQTPIFTRCLRGLAHCQISGFGESPAIPIVQIFATAA